ncbi:MAG: XRE family transcriptional regulator [Mesorhizobium amorphae]|nr:MAG: XRE family transcriptional regulator [Mesorhizobium amorphae]
MEIQKRVGKNVRDVRRSAGLSQEGLVAKLELIDQNLGVDQGYISRLESGNHNPTLITLWRIAQALEVPLERLVTAIDPSR